MLDAIGDIILAFGYPAGLFVVRCLHFPMNDLPDYERIP